MSESSSLGSLRPLVTFGAMRAKAHDEKVVKNKAARLALGMNLDGIKESLSWLRLFREPGGPIMAQGVERAKYPGVAGILIAALDGLKGFAETISSVFTQAQAQTCIVHMVRHGLALCALEGAQRSGRRYQGRLYKAGTP